MEQSGIPPSRPSTTADSFVGLPLWEEVKKTIYFYWIECNRLLKEIDKQRIYNRELEDESIKHSEEFRAAVLQLYRSCRSKLSYPPESNESIKRLKEMNLDDCLRRPWTLDFEKSVEVFILLTDFLELDGVTRFEKKVLDPQHAAVLHLEEGD